jgi:hypothetical protein
MVKRRKASIRPRPLSGTKKGLHVNGPYHCSPRSFATHYTRDSRQAGSLRQLVTVKSSRPAPRRARFADATQRIFDGLQLTDNTM